MHWANEYLVPEGIYICMYSVDLPIVSDSSAKLRSHLSWQLPQQQKENNTLNHLGALSWKMHKITSKIVAVYTNVCTKPQLSRLYF